MHLRQLLEPEETVGGIWHRLVGGASTIAHFPEAAVGFDEVAARLRVYFRGLGGAHGVILQAAAPQVSKHRRHFTSRLGKPGEKVATARFDGDNLNLPDQIDAFPDRALNELCYYWLAAWIAVGGESSMAPPDADLPGHDLRRIGRAAEITGRVLAAFPGLRPAYERLRQATLELRPRRELPDAEALIESEIASLLSRANPTDWQASPATGSAQQMAASRSTLSGRRYHTYLPVPIWAEIESAGTSRPADRDDEQAQGARGKADDRVRHARRRKSDQSNRQGGFFAHRFEKILTWAEFMNLHRNIDDDDEETAAKAADDHDHIDVTTITKRAATRLAFNLDLSPADANIAALSARYVYPEWDYRRKCYHADHACVLEHRGAADEASPSSWQPDEKAERRIADVRRQFEALRPRRELLLRQIDGNEIDTDAVVRSLVELLATGDGSDRLFAQSRNAARDLSVAVLLDTSRSTDSFVGNHRVIDVAREALIALAEGIERCGDNLAIFTFSSLKRDRVFVNRVKNFDETSGPAVRARICALHPGHYTRLGGAIRHTSNALSQYGGRKRLLLVLTDGKPNDLDHYEGRYGIEDTRIAIQEARRLGHAVFGITIDSKAQSYFPRIFGPGGFAILSHPSRLTKTLPILYRHLIAS